MQTFMVFLVILKYGYNFFFIWYFQVVCLLILVADIVVDALYLSPVAFNSLPLRIAPYIRVIFLILNIRYFAIKPISPLFFKLNSGGIKICQIELNNFDLVYRNSFCDYSTILSGYAQ